MPKRELVRDFTFAEGAELDSQGTENLSDVGDLVWTVNDSSMRDYSKRARLKRSTTGTLAEIIVSRIGRREDNVGLDIAAGSNAPALRSLMRSGVIGQALATNYEDRLKDKYSKDLDHISGNLAEVPAWKAIVDWQANHAPEGFAVVMHRPVGGLQYLPTDFYRGAIRTVLDMVRPGGLVFTQIPRWLVHVENDRESICTEVQERPDVTRVWTTPPPLPGAERDHADHFAIIYK